MENDQSCRTSKPENRNLPPGLWFGVATLLFGVIGVVMAATDGPPTDGAATISSRGPVNEVSDRSVVRVGSVRTEPYRGSLHTRGSSTATRKALAQRPTVDLTDRFGWRGDAAMIVADESGRPWINLEDGRELQPVFAGEKKILERLESELAEPLGLASADFDEDGIPDLITTYAAETSGGAGASGGAEAPGGFVTLHIGNPDSIYPHAPEALQRKSAGNFTPDPFLVPAVVFETPVAGFWVGAGDFDADGHKDLVLAARDGASLFHLPGDGRGGFGVAREIPLDGRITALTTGEINRRDGLEDVVIGIESRYGPEVLVFEWPEGAFLGDPEVLEMPDVVVDLALAELDGEYPIDLAVASGYDLVIARGRDRRLAQSAEARANVEPPVMDTRSMQFRIVELETGRFTGDIRKDLALLGEDGRVSVLERVSEDPVAAWALTSTEQPVVGLSKNSLDSPSVPRLVRARVSSLHGDDVVVVDTELSRVRVMTAESVVSVGSGEPPRVPSPVSIDAGGRPAAVLPIRLNRDALNDLVVLKASGAPVAYLTTSAARSFVVNDSGDEDDAKLGDEICETDGGTCTFRAALHESSVSDGATDITFSVSSATLSSGGSAFAQNPVTIDGTSQGMVRVFGTTPGIGIRGDDSVVRGLDIGAISIQGAVLSDTFNNLIEGNYIGIHTDEDYSGIFTGLDLYEADTLIGGRAESARNVIVGENQSIYIRGEDASDIRVEGNYIGTDPTGTSALGGGDGIYILVDAVNNTVGGSAAGAGNVISGNARDGIDVGSTSSGNLIQGNFIGTDPTGRTAVPNGNSGVAFSSTSFSNTLGGTTPTARNIVSGNMRHGVSIWGDAAENLIHGNYIGTDVTGTTDLGNSQEGISVSTPNARIGGVAAGAGNLISGNEWNGVNIYSEADGARVEGNRIGTDAGGTAAIANGVPGSSSRGNGVSVSTSSNTVIGGTESGAGNLISGNINDGINIAGSAGNNRVLGNTIGTTLGGSGELPNGGDGIYGGASLGAVIGTDAPNIIAHNGGAGVQVGGQGIEIRANSIFDNQKLGINIGSDGVQNNDNGDTDGGGNNGQNFPVLTSAIAGTIEGTLDSTPSTSYTVDFYSNTACDPSGHGEGEEHLGSVGATTDGEGFASFSTSLEGVVGYITATATDPDGNTSEFCECILANTDAGPSTLVIDLPPTLKAGDTPFVRVRVLNQGGTVNAGFYGDVRIDLTANPAGIATLRSNGQTGNLLVIPMAAGLMTEDVVLQTPASALTQDSVITPQTVLEGSLTINASDGDELSASKDIPVESPLDLRVDRIEVQQGARSDPPGKMILDKTLLVRIFVEANTVEFSTYKAIEGITAKLHFAKADGQPTTNPTVLVEHAEGVIRTSPNKPFVFKKSWTQNDRLWGRDTLNHLTWVRTNRQLRLKAELESFPADRDDENNSASLGPLTFNESPQLTLLFARGRLDDGTNRTEFPPPETIALATRFFAWAYPVSKNRLRIVKLPDETVSANPLPRRTNDRVAFWLNRTTEANVKGYVYLVDGHFLGKVGYGSATGVTAGLGGYEAIVNTATCTSKRGKCNTLAHEIGHMHRLGDTYASGKPNNQINPRLPTATASGNPVEDGTRESYNGWFSVAGARDQSRDIMGHTRRDSWIDQITWDHLKATVGLGTIARKSAAGTALIVRGRIVRSGGADLVTCYTFDRSPFDDAFGPGDFVIETLGEDNSVLDSVEVEPDYTIHDSEMQLENFTFGVELPFTASIRTIRIRSGNDVLDSIEVSDTDPTAEFTSSPSGSVAGQVNVTWQGSDADGDPLIYSLFYSPDGQLMIPLTEETTATSFSWSSGGYLSGDAPRLALVASDGVRSVVVESDVFDVPDRDPEVFISEPADGARFKPKDPVPLTATVFDPEDGPAAGDAEIRWTSDRDGSLGTGEFHSAEGLSVGTHVITASFTDSAGNTGSDSVTVEVTNGPVCELSCAPSAPGTAMTGEQVDFSAGVSASNCTDPVEHIWDFGDGSAEASSENPSHSYFGTGYHSWQLIATSGAVSCSSVDGISINDGMDHRYLIPASAHSPGAEGTSWVTDVVLHDPGSLTAVGGLSFHEKDRDNSSADAEAVLVGRGYSLMLDDVVEATFSEDSSSGAIRVSSDQPLIVSSRTYNDAAGGTFGQYVPGLPESEAIETGEEVRLIQLTRTDDFRTNIGFASLNPFSINVIVDLYRSDGSQIKAKAYSVEPHGYRQINDIIGKLAGGDVDEAYAVVYSNTTGARYFTYASVVDNRSGDPVMILPVSSSAAASGACAPDNWVSLDPQGRFIDDRFYGSFSAGTRHFVIGDHGLIITSTDGTSWNTVPSGTDALLLAGVWSGTRYVIVGGGGVILTSTNGTSWTTIETGSQRGLTDVAWGAGKFVAVGYGGTILTSLNGQSWTERSSGATRHLRGVAWNGTRFVAVGDGDAPGGGTILTSNNGVTWTARTPAAGNGWSTAVIWAGGQFVAVGANGDIATSPDGIAWTDRSTEILTWWDDVIWDGFQYVVVGGSARVFTSPDGIEWTNLDFDPSPSIRTILWTGDRHVVAGSSGGFFGSPLCSPTEPLWITAGAHAVGVGGTNWVTDLEIHNPDDSQATVTISLLPKGSNNTFHQTRQLTVEAGSSRRITDVMYSFFDYTGSAALRITAQGAAVMVGSRTYNNAPTGTFGQFVPGVPESEAVSGGSVRLVQLSRSASQSSGFRTNIGFANMGTAKITVTVELYDGTGTLLGTTEANVKPYGQNQITDIFGKVTSGDVANGYAIVSSGNPGARFMTYASVVDNRSGDPIYIPAN